MDETAAMTDQELQSKIREMEQEIRMSKNQINNLVNENKARQMQIKQN
jgi:26S proteasome regulatory subunit T5